MLFSELKPGQKFIIEECGGSTEVYMRTDDKSLDLNGVNTFPNAVCLNDGTFQVIEKGARIILILL